MALRNGYGAREPKLECLVTSMGLLHRFILALREGTDKKIW